MNIYPELEYISEAYNVWKKLSLDKVPDSPTLIQALLIFDEEVERLREVQRNRKHL